VKLRLPLGIAAIVALLGAVVVAGQNSGPQQAAKSKAPPAQTTANESAEGEKRFAINCGRCHVPPESLSPREVRAVLRQMRVRANLTAEDERLILKYLAP
jgi:cytochrome c5